ncbi:MAG: hypothetical protein QXV82_08285 [Ignisphaera sp.]
MLKAERRAAIAATITIIKGVIILGGISTTFSSAIFTSLNEKLFPLYKIYYR